MYMSSKTIYPGCNLFYLAQRERVLINYLALDKHCCN